MTSMQDKLAALRAKIKSDSATSSAPVATNAPSIIPVPERKSLLTQESKLPVSLLQSVTSLEEALLDRHPRMPGLLSEVYKALKAQPENVTLMNEEEIHVIVECLKVQTGVEFAEKITKSKSASAKLKNATTEMF